MKLEFQWGKIKEKTWISKGVNETKWKISGNFRVMVKIDWKSRGSCSKISIQFALQFAQYHCFFFFKMKKKNNKKTNLRIFIQVINIM